MGTSTLGERATSWHWWLLTLGATLVGVLPLLPPGVDDDPSPTALSTARARDHIEWIAAEPHPVGSAANARVRDRIAGELEAIGLAARRQTTTAPNWYGGSASTVDVVNVLARVPGTDPTGAVAVVGHYDSFPATPGANDNASAVALMLEMARVLMAGEPLRNDVLFVFTDGEEPAPRYGSTAFVVRHPWSRDVEFVINLEAIGSGGPSLLIETNGPAWWVLDRYVDSVPHPAAFSFVTEFTDLIGGSNTDFAPFRDAGVAGVEFAYLTGSPIYHTPSDTPDRVGERSLHQHGQNALALTRHIGEVDLGAPRNGGAPVFFTIGRGTVVRFPGWLAVVALVAGGGALAVSLRRTPDARRAGRGALVALGLAAGPAIAGTLGWLAVCRWRPDLGVAESYAYLLVGVTLMWLATSTLERSRGVRAASEGVLVLWWLLAVLAALIGAGVSSLFAFPVLVGSAALLLRRRWHAPAAAGSVQALALVVALVLLVPAVDVFFQFAQPRPGNPDSEVAWAIVVPLLLIALIVQLVRACADPETGNGTNGRSATHAGRVP